MLKNTFNKFKTRIQNPKILTSLISGILLVLVNIGVVTVNTQHHVMDAVNTILGLLVGIGVFSDPTSHVKSVPVKETITPITQPAPVEVQQLVTQPTAPTEPQTK